MAEKKATGFIKLQIPAGAANPAPPVGPALGQHGVNIMQFCQAFNAQTQDKSGTIIPVAPPVGPALGQHGVNIMQFCQAFNAQTQDKSGTIIPVEITVYEDKDKSFTFVCKTPPAAVLIKEKLGIKGGSGIPQLQAVGTLTEDQLREIAETKLPDLNANTVEAAMEIIAGTARSMGVRIEGREMKKKYIPSRKVAAMLQGKSIDE